MLREENELLTRVGPGTPMGQLLRQYWIPALLSSEIAAPDCPPIRIRLLGENLIAFRDTQGRVGLLADHCSHRGASLFFGRNEEGGLRCVYHGWKYDISGRCVDMPNEPPETSFREKIQHCAYPCQERGGVVWAYMGQARPAADGDSGLAGQVAVGGPASGARPAAEGDSHLAGRVPGGGLATGLPPLPNIEANMQPAGQEQIWCALRECNWVQGLEGEIDTSHFGFLHRVMGPDYHPKPHTFDYYMEKDRQPRYSVVETNYGALYGAYRPAGEDTYYWRIAQFLMPFFSMIPPGVLGRQIITRAWVPLDDEHTMFWSFSTQNARAPEVEALEGRPPASINVVEVLPNTSDWLGRWRLAANRTNDYQLDRKAQRTTSFTGLPGVHMQDQAITESMGAIYDRSQEHLGTADAMVVKVRQVLLDAVKALRDRGQVPVTVDRPELYEVRSGGTVLPRNVDWIEATEEARKAFPKEPVPLPR